MSTISLRSFSSGELTPELYSRVDIQKYQTGLKTCRNFQIQKMGGVQNRPGTEFIGEVYLSTQAVRLIPFIFSDDQTYVLEFSDIRMRVIKNGSYVTNTAQNITAITNANPCVVTYSGSDNFVSQDRIYIEGIVGPIGTYLNGRYFRVGTVDTGANTITLKDLGGTDVNSTSYGAYTSGGTIEELYSITSPYQLTEIDDLQFSQSGDIITIAHQSYAPRELSRTADNSWSFSTITFTPDIARPEGSSGSAGAGITYQDYVITAIDSQTGEESLVSLGSAKNISAITQANPGLITSNGHALVPNDVIYISGILGMTELNDRYFVVSGVEANILNIANIDTGSLINTTSYTAYSSGGSMKKVGVQLIGVLAPSSTNTIYLNWLTVTGAIYYNVYRGYARGESGNDTSLFGQIAYAFIAKTTELSFVDTGLALDYDKAPPELRTTFDSSNNYPGVVSYAQQRIFYANTINNPETFWASKIGCYHNFINPITITDDSPITGTLANRRVQAIKHLIDLDKMLCLTSGSEIAFIGQDLGLVTPAAINPKTQSYNGANNLRPILIDNNMLYCQARSSIIRDFLYDLASDVYRGNDITIFSKHLFEGYTIVDWDFQQNNDSILWCVRSDGVLLGCTYIREQQILAWHRHDFQGGTVENVCVVPEGSEDAVYLVINRTINGRTCRYLERFGNRFIDDIIDKKFMDSALTYDGRHTGATTMTLSGSGWTYEDTLTLTASASTFLSTDVGNEIHLTGSDGTLIRFVIDTYSSATVVTGRPHKTVPAAMRATAISYSATLGTGWSRAVDVVTGLWHLEGEAVSVFADSFVVGSPNNPDYPTYTVASGLITLDRPYSVIHVGLPYISDLETLDIDYDQNDTISNKGILVSEIAMRVHNSRSAWVGSKAPTDDDTDPLEGLTELKIRTTENYDSAVNLTSDVLKIQIESHWNSNGRVFIRNTEPLPLAISSIFPSGKMPGGA